MRETRAVLWCLLIGLAISIATPGVAAARWGVGPAVRPGVVPHFSGVETSWGAPLVMSAGVRAFGQKSPFFRMGGEAFYDFPTATISGGGMLEGVIPLGLLEIDLGGIVGYSTWGLFLEPGVSAQLNLGVMALNFRLSYQIQLYNPELCCNLPHRGMTYLAITVFFGDLMPVRR